MISSVTEPELSITMMMSIGREPSIALLVTAAQPESGSKTPPVPPLPPWPLPLPPDPPLPLPPDPLPDPPLPPPVFPTVTPPPQSHDANASTAPMHSHVLVVMVPFSSLLLRRYTPQVAIDGHLSHMGVPLDRVTRGRLHAPDRVGADVDAVLAL